MSYLDHIEACNRFNEERFVPFIVDGIAVGKIARTTLPLLEPYPDIFDVTNSSVLLARRLSEFEERSTAVAEVVADLKAIDAIPPGDPESYPVTRAFGDTAHFQIDRSAARFFGIPAFGVHMHGYCRDGDGSILMWVGRRSDHIRMYPGKLDNTVAGGQPIGLSLMDNLVKECEEEAGIPEPLARQAEPVGQITYRLETEAGFSPDTLF